VENPAGANGGASEKNVHADRLNTSEHKLAATAVQAARARTPRRQHLARHLHAAGPRPVLEALLELEAGRPLDAVLESYGRIPVGIFHELGADKLCTGPYTVVDGGAR
jgi:hypothetical protein